LSATLQGETEKMCKVEPQKFKWYNTFN